MSRCFHISMLIWGALLIGCGDHSSHSQAPATAPAAQTDHPTTQDLLTGPRHRLTLQPFAPLSLEVPASWSVESLADGRIVLLQGPAPGDVVHISISPRRMMSAEEVSLLETGAKREQAAHPNMVKKVDFRSLGTAKLYERQAIMGPVSSQPTTAPSPTLRWSYTVFIPDHQQFYSYELSFVGLSVSQYEADQGFLKSIMDTLQIEPDTGAKGP